LRHLVVLIFFVLCALIACGQAVAAQLDATIEASLLAEVESALAATRGAVENISVDDLGLTYRDGKQVDALRQIVLDWAKLGHQHLANTRRSPGVESAVALLTGLSELRIGVRDFSSALEHVGATSESAAAVRAAIPFIDLVIKLDSVSSKIDRRVHAITVAADVALKK